MLIGITGKAGSGKDTFAKFLSEKHNFTRYAIASPIKRMIQAGFGVDPGVWDDREAKEKPIEWLDKSPRYLAQTLGTDWGRELVHGELWLLIAQRVVGEHENLIITDVRFDNEAEFIHKNGGHLIEVTRPDGIPDVDNTAHASESGISDRFGRFTVANSGTIDELRDKAEIMLAILHA